MYFFYCILEKANPTFLEVGFVIWQWLIYDVQSVGEFGTQQKMYL